MAINYTDWNNGIKNGTFYPLGYNRRADIPGVVLDGAWIPWYSYPVIKNNFAYSNNQVKAYIDTASYEYDTNYGEYTITMMAQSGNTISEASLNWQNLKGQLVLDYNSSVSDKLKINAPQIEALSVRDSMWEQAPKILDLNFKNADAVVLDHYADYDENDKGCLKISGTNLREICVNGDLINLEFFDINCPHLEDCLINGHIVSNSLNINTPNSIFVVSGTLETGYLKLNNISTAMINGSLIADKITAINIEECCSITNRFQVNDIEVIGGNYINPFVISGIMIIDENFNFNKIHHIQAAEGYAPFYCNGFGGNLSSYTPAQISTMFKEWNFSLQGLEDILKTLPAGNNTKFYFNSYIDWEDIAPPMSDSDKSNIESKFAAKGYIIELKDIWEWYY